MDWKTRLISVYVKTCDLWKQGLFTTVARMSNIGPDRKSGIPITLYIGLASASVHDITMFKQLAPELGNSDIFADKAYCNGDDSRRYKEENNLCIATPIKLKKERKDSILLIKYIRN